jgi:transposase InsO family protein
MARQGLAGRFSRPKTRTTRRDPDQAPAADLVHRDSTGRALVSCGSATRPCIWTAEGWCCLATVVDACSRRVLGWSITDHPRTELCLDGLLAAVAARCGRRHLAAGIVFHTDHGTTP